MKQHILIMTTIAALLLTLGCSTEKTISGCMTLEEFNATTDKCLVIYDGMVYDLSKGPTWSLMEGHFGHMCGKEYDRETIEKGGHGVGIMSGFEYMKLCPE